MKLWVDDLRTPPDDSWHWAKDAWHAIHVLESNKIVDEMFMDLFGDSAGPIEVMSLDHDLGDGHTSRQIVLWMCENNYWPLEVRVHTANPVGREWLEGMIERYKP